MLRNCLILAVVLALPGFLYNRLFWLGGFCVLPVLWLIIRGWMILTWPMAQGEITNVSLDNDEDAPCTGAEIVYHDKDGAEHACYQTISHYGDYEEGCEPLLQEMLQKDTENYLGRKVHVFYHRKKPDKVITYLEDSVSSETEGEK